MRLIEVVDQIRKGATLFRNGGMDRIAVHEPSLGSQRTKRTSGLATVVLASVARVLLTDQIGNKN